MPELVAVQTVIIRSGVTPFREIIDARIAEIRAGIAELHAEAEELRPRIYRLCWARLRNPDLAEEITQVVFYNYVLESEKKIKRLEEMMQLLGVAVNVQIEGDCDEEMAEVRRELMTDLFEDVDGIQTYKGFAELLRRTAGGLRLFTKPEAWLKTVAENTCNQYWRDRSRRREGLLDDEMLPIPNGLSSRQRNPEELFRDHETKEQYVKTLPRLNRWHRAAWLLCRDTLFLPEDIAEQVNRDTELSKDTILQALTATRERMPVVDVGRLLGERPEGTISSDLSRVKSLLAREFEKLDPWRAWRTRPKRWAREFMVGRSARTVSRGVTIFPGISTRRLHDDHQPSSTDPSGVGSYNPHEISPGWLSAPEVDPKIAALLKTIRDLSPRWWRTRAEILTDRGVPPVYGNKWHATAVELIARRNGP